MGKRRGLEGAELEEITTMIKTTRLPDWRSRLYQLIAEYESVPFEFGSNDCALWAGRVVNAVTGDDVFSEYVGRYKTATGGYRAFKKATGFASHIEYVKSTLELEQNAFAQAGDLGFVETDEGQAIVVLLGSFAAGIGEAGLVRYPIENVTDCFKLGRE